ncbi:hypothetical protein QWY97_17765 [Vibrio cortegadensis]|uniref:hypothetical protein n=1 Tax=Vibrio cortegadensis TaxID=1328770 RepID=UPI0021C4B1DB|nr:hypothetical protein [Vibrio cortegadensis]MDN3699174.1 hypothetical protein [Vibrio cortegadensis]
MLSQAIYWSRRTNASGYFYKTQSEWEDETGMTRRELDTARKKLRELGILEEKKQGVPCRIFYRINEPTLIEQLRHSSLAECAKQSSTKAPSSGGGISQTKTETTHRLPETTTNKLCGLEVAFEPIWKIYPTKKGKKQALAKFKSIVKGRTETTEQFSAMLLADITERINRCQFGFDKLHLTTYLNQERWNDEHENNQSNHAKPSLQPNRYEQHNADLLARYGHTAAPSGQSGDPVERGGLGSNQVCGSLRGEVAAQGTTIDLDSSDYHNVGQ